MKLSTYKKPAFDRKRFKKLVHYICHYVEKHDQLGKTKLNKILYYADNIAYLKFGRPITGETYIKHQYGPVAQHLDEILNELEAEGKLVVAENRLSYGDKLYQQVQFITTKHPDIEDFSAEEIDLIRDVIDYIVNTHTARSISETSHNIVWKSARMGEELPYFTAYGMFVKKITPEDIAWAKEQFK